MLAERYASVKQAAQSRSVQGLRRPAYLLSGLLECGTCGGTYAVVVGDRYGCVGHHRSRSRSEEHTSELQSLMRISYAVFCLKKKKKIHMKVYTSAHDRT